MCKKDLQLTSTIQGFSKATDELKFEHQVNEKTLEEVRLLIGRNEDELFYDPVKIPDHLVNKLASILQSTLMPELEYYACSFIDNEQEPSEG